MKSFKLPVSCVIQLLAHELLITSAILLSGAGNQLELQML